MTKRTIEIDEDPAFQQREWFAQRIGIGVLVLFVAAAMLGFTGNGGPFSRGETSDSSGTLRVEYERIVRRGAQNTITLHLHGTKPGPRSFWLSTEYLRSVDVEAVVPDPEVVSTDGGRYVYAISTAALDATITIRSRPTRTGRINVDLGVVDGPAVRFHQASLF